MIRIGSAISTSGNAVEAANEVFDGAMASLGDSPVDLAFVFVSSAHGEAVKDIVASLAPRLGKATLLGCTTQATIGEEREVEEGPAVSLWVASLPGAILVPFDVSFRQTPDGSAVVGFPILEDHIRAVFLLADPYTFPTQHLLESLNDDYPELPVFGGQASGAGAGQISLILGDKILGEGAVGVQVGGAIDVTPLVSQGCKPIGEPYIVTAARGNIIHQLGGKPPLFRLREIMSKMTREERARAAHNLHLGVVIDERKADPAPGDFLIRAVLQADPETGAVSVGDVLSVGQTVQFQVRDAATADADLRNLLEEKLRQTDGRDPQGALLFTCNGRGANLFGAPDHDVSALRDHVPGMPVAGMFCGGEIGPIGGKNFLHGYTASVALFLDPFPAREET
ncbi:MAG TPA: FIST N-terminal domain-containing protein [Actinomycetota bacterium]|nr:FIST N-terminal domain-containing protein [Actinomycetota bacterium]